MLTDFRKKKLKKVFTFYDANKNQGVDMSDIDAISQRFTKELGWTASGVEAGEFRKALKDHWVSMIDEADVNMDKKVSYDEFLDYYNVALSSDEMFYQRIKPLFDALYKAADSEDRGVISKKKYVALYRAFGNKQEEAERAFRALDKNDDSLISHFELYSAFYHFFMSDDSENSAKSFFGHI